MMANERVEVNLIVLGQFLLEVPLSEGGQVSLGNVVDLELVQAEQLGNRPAVEIGQHRTHCRRLICQVPQHSGLVIAFDVVDLGVWRDGASRAQDLLVHELDPAHYVPLTRVDAVLAELWQIRDVAIEDDDVGLHALDGFQPDAQEERVTLDVVQVGANHQGLPTTGGIPFVLDRVIGAIQVHLAIMVDGRVLGDVAFELMLLARQFQACLALEFLEGAEETVPGRFRNGTVVAEVVACDDDFRVLLRDPAQLCNAVFRVPILHEFASVFRQWRFRCRAANNDLGGAWIAFGDVTQESRLVSGRLDRNAGCFSYVGNSGVTLQVVPDGNELVQIDFFSHVLGRKMRVTKKQAYSACCFKCS